MKAIIPNDPRYDRTIGWGIIQHDTGAVFADEQEMPFGIVLYFAWANDHQRYVLGTDWGPVDIVRVGTQTFTRNGKATVHTYSMEEPVQTLGIWQANKELNGFVKLPGWNIINPKRDKSPAALLREKKEKEREEANRKRRERAYQKKWQSPYQDWYGLDGTYSSCGCPACPPRGQHAQSKV